MSVARATSPKSSTGRAIDATAAHGSLDSATSRAACDVDVVCSIGTFEIVKEDRGTGPARARSCARSIRSAPARRRVERAGAVVIGMTISRTITSSWSKTRPSMVADTVPSIAFSSGTSPWSRVESATAERTSAMDSHATGVDVLHRGDGFVRERALGPEVANAQRFPSREVLRDRVGPRPRDFEGRLNAYDRWGSISKGRAMGHPMFEYDAELANEVFDYCRDRLSMDPVPLDFGSLHATAPGDMTGFIRPEGHNADEILEFFKNDLAPAVVSIDSPGFLAFIPNAPTKNSLLFDMVVACSGLNGTSWLESSGVVMAENQALEFLASSRRYARRFRRGVRVRWLARQPLEPDRRT